MISVESIRKKLRLSENVFDDEIKDNISACLEDLERTGVIVTPDKSHRLLDKAIELYNKWQFDFRGKGETYKVNYEATRDSMSLSPIYYTQKVEG